ncbi:hypothetical protein QAD02_011262 [Eretmocerus hayati]|uniref:Uncharacterized protein n=1 Tax=Eretmocerus hayati TaxID=131215 RepID=A0ACC2NXZ7_9HYME|nr:hypothetical protein QAD02_011262 [Eretmocerus hayati]
MVSPSKLQQQQRDKAKARNAVASSGASAAGGIRIQRGAKPLEKKLFYLDIKNHVLSAKLEERIKELGGVIELFLVKGVSLIVTDKPNKPSQANTSDRSKWGYASGGSGGPPSLRSVEVPTPTPTPPTPYRSVEGPLSNSTNQRGPTTQRSKSRVDAMLERALIHPQQCTVDPLSNAANWGIPIWTTYELNAWLDKLTASVRDANNIKRDNKKATAAVKEVKVKHLKNPFIKFESYRRETRPIFVELQAWPTINFDGEPGSCPFDVKKREKKEVESVNKEIKENREKHHNHNKTKGKDMTRRPRAPATRARKTENTGYCEICRTDYRSLTKHLQSDQHNNFIQDNKNFLSLDNLISTGASVEAFLSCNRPKDVRRHCNPFHRKRDHSLDNGILSAHEKSEKIENASLRDFNLDDMKMMQCNGARRNLNLDSAHNLRTRSKHESGHLLRSMGKPLDDLEKNERSSERYIIKKRAKGIVWIEEDSEDDDNPDKEQVDFDGKPLIDKLSPSDKSRKDSNNGEDQSTRVRMNGDVDFDAIDSKQKVRDSIKAASNDNTLKESFTEANLKNRVNGYEKREDRRRMMNEPSLDSDANEVGNANQTDVADVANHECGVSNEKPHPHDDDDSNSLNSVSNSVRDGRSRSSRRGAKGFRGFRNRPRLSVEERLIEDNRAYYKVEVLGNKLRSSAMPISTFNVSPKKEQGNETKKDDEPSSEKPVVIRFNRVRRSELSLLSDEAESFMFGDPKRDDDSSEQSDCEQSSILPKDTESDRDPAINSLVMSSSPAANLTPKQEVPDDDIHDSAASRARKRRRTQTEALLMDNTDYYKFETPGSRLRFQAPLTGISDPQTTQIPSQLPNVDTEEEPQKILPSKPSPKVEKMHFSFEAVPRSEAWYQTYHRQDEGAEFYYFSEIDDKPFLLPYEIENFHEILAKSIQNSAHHKRSRGRGNPANCRSPRKSPRCHASTLAIMSTIIRRKELQTTNLSTIEEEGKKKSSNETAKSAKKSSEKSDVDKDLNELVKNIDNMLSENDSQELDEFDSDILKLGADTALGSDVTPKGPPSNLVEMLENYSDAMNCIENSSCASSDCGEFGSEHPSKRRKKKRKNLTGWPGNKMRRKLQIKHLAEELQKEYAKEFGTSLEQNDNEASEALGDDASNADEDGNNNAEQEDERVSMTPSSKRGRGRKGRGKMDKDELIEESEGKSATESVVDSETPSRRKKASLGSPTRIKVEIEDESEFTGVKRRRNLLSMSEESEASLSNKEVSLVRRANTSSPRRKPVSPKFKRKRQRSNTMCSEASQQTGAEHIRRQISTSPRKSQKSSSETGNIPLARRMKMSPRGRRKMTKLSRLTSKAVAQARNCRKPFLGVGGRGRPKKPRRIDSVSSDILQNGEGGDSLDSLSISASDVDQRRSSIDLQPVVRVMKIEDQVDIDSNSVISVSVASNRRLRSSSSPKTCMQPPKKRFKDFSVGRRQQMTSQWVRSS